MDEQAAYLLAHGITDRKDHEYDRHHRDVDPKVLYAVLGLRRHDNESDGALTTVAGCIKSHAKRLTLPSLSPYHISLQWTMCIGCAMPPRLC